MSLFKITGLLLFIVFPIFLNGQNIVSRTNKRFSIGVSFSPDYSYRVLKTDASHQRLADMDNELYSPKFSNTSGLVLKYMIGEKLALESGIRFSDKGKKMVVNKGDLVDAFGNTVVDPAVPNKSTTVYHYQYIGIPLKLNYYILQKRIKFFVSGGVSTDLFLSGKSKYVNEFNDRTERGGSDLEGDFNKVNFVGLFGVGMESDISSQLSFRFEPAFRYSFVSDVKDPVKEYFYSIGVNLVLLGNY